MNFYEMAKNVDSKESFLLFVQALAEDAKRAAAEPELTADGKINLSPGGWENGKVESFLEAMSAWASDNSSFTGQPMVSGQASWSAFAQMLHAGKFYE